MNLVELINLLKIEELERLVAIALEGHKREESIVTELVPEDTENLKQVVRALDEHLEGLIECKYSSEVYAIVAIASTMLFKMYEISNWKVETMNDLNCGLTPEEKPVDTTTKALIVLFSG